MKNKYDICVATFNDLRFDGRAQNLIECLLQQGKKVISFSIQLPNATAIMPPQPPGYTRIIVDIPHQRRVFIKLLTFLQSVKSHLTQAECDVFWAADFYSLPLTRSVKSVRKIIYDSREIYTALGSLHNSAIRQRVIAYLERKYIKAVSALVTSGKRDSAHLTQLYNLTIPVYEIHNYPKTKELITSNVIRESLNIPTNKTILLYQGVLSEGRGLVPAMEALRSEFDTEDLFVLVVIGSGSETYTNYLASYAKQIGVSSKVFFAGQVDYTDLHSWTCSADIGLCNIEPISLSYQMALPNKLFEYMLAELPVLATDLPALAEVVQATGCGKLISPQNNPSEIVSTAQWLCAQQQTIKSNLHRTKTDYVYETQHSLISKIVKIT